VCRRVGALLAAHDAGAGDLGPVGELLGGRGTERVGGGQHHVVPVARLALSNLGDGGRLADPVDAHEHPHIRFAGDVLEGARLAGGVEQGHQFAVQHTHQRVGVGDLVGLGALLHVGEDALGGGDTDVGEEQRVLEFVPGVVVDPPPPQFRERSPRLAQAVAESDRLEVLGLRDNFVFFDNLDFLDDLRFAKRRDFLGLDGNGGLSRRDRRPGCMLAGGLALGLVALALA